jgi:glycosyltransferase involved in cell wall biosynthesis
MPAAIDHIAINACFLDPGVSGGPEFVLMGLVPAIARAAPNAKLSVLTTRRGAAGLKQAGWCEFAELVALPADEGERVRRLVSEVSGVPRWVARNRPSVVHSLSNLGAPRPMKSPHVLYLHDLTFIRVPTFSKLTTFAMSQLALRSARHSERITTATSASADELVELGHLDRSKIDLVPHGRRPILPVTEEVVEDVRDQWRLGGCRVVLCVAAKRPHKNQEVLVRAIKELPRGVVLVLAGHPEAYDQELRALAESTGVADRVRFLDYVTDEQLEALWKLAAVAAFPTRGEGFGLPVIEAMDRGVPVACSDIPVLAEVSGGLAAPFDPDDPSAAAAAIQRQLDAAPDRDALRAHAAAFTWQRAAELSLDSYERAIAARG